MPKPTPLDFCQETISKKHFLEVGWIELCGRLKDIRDKEMYKGRWENFEDFLQDPALGMDKSTASRMITIHEKLILEYEIEPKKIAEAGGWTKVSELLPVVSDKQSAEEWLEKASTLSQADLRKEVKEERGGGKGIDCKHPNTYQITIRICRECDHKQTIKTDE